MLHVLIIGGGAREHALALLASRSPMGSRVSALLQAPNPGIGEVVERTGGRIITGDPRRPEDALRAAEETSPDLVVVGPEEALFAGVADILREHGFTVFGPGRSLALIEMDKSYARSLMWRHRIPGRLRYAAFADPGEAAAYARAAGDVVVKPARQAGGRGVRVFAKTLEHVEAEEAAGAYAARLAEQMASRYRDVDARVIVEERVDGVEYTVTIVTDGSSFVALPVVQDNPHLFPYDLGPETGGMGAIAGPGLLLPFLSRSEYLETVSIVERTVKALQEERGSPYRGAVSGQMMLTGLWGPTVIEFYSRFGDPETGTLIPLVESDFLELLDRAASGRLAGYRLRVREDVYVVSKAVAPAGYPHDRGLARGHPVRFERDSLPDGCVLLVGSLAAGQAGLVTGGSRLAEIVCWSRLSHGDASRLAEKAIASGVVQLTDGHPLVHRWDIGCEEQLAKRARQAELARISYTRRRVKKLTSIADWVPGRGLVIYDYS